MAGAGDTALRPVPWRGALASRPRWRSWVPRESRSPAFRTAPGTASEPRPPAPGPAPRPRAPPPQGALRGRGQLTEPLRDWPCPSNRGDAVVNRPRGWLLGHREIERLGSFAPSADPSPAGIAALSAGGMRTSPVLPGHTAPGGWAGGC